MKVKSFKSSILGSVVSASLMLGCGLTKSDDSTDNGGDKADKYTVNGDYSTVIDGAQDGDVSGSSFQIDFSVTGPDLEMVTVDHFECKFDDKEWEPCTTPFAISGLKDGQDIQLSVRAVLISGEGDNVMTQYAKDMSMDFSVNQDQNQGPIPTQPVQGALSNDLQVGSFYRVVVGDGMHVTEYSTTKTYNGVLSYFRIMNEMDPFYLGNHKCQDDWDRIVASFSPAEEVLNYCHSTPDRETYKASSEYRLANNHVSLSTDTMLIGETNQERLTFASYDSDFEFVDETSRFKALCRNSKISYIDVPMVNNFFLGAHPETVRFWYCDSSVVGMDGSQQDWRIGSFFSEDKMDHVQHTCAECSYDRGLEVVYIARANASILRPERFARKAQEKVLKVLQKDMP